MPSHRANHYGTAVEHHVIDEYSLSAARASWKDAEFGNGTPVEIKSCALEHADGAKGNFKLYEQYHRKLGRAGGWYCFGVYRTSPFRLLKTKMVRHGDVPRLSWHGGGEHREARQAKLYPGEIWR